MMMERRVKETWMVIAVSCDVQLQNEVTVGSTGAHYG